MRLPHIFHNDPDWQEHGVWRYHECRCGARRITRATANLIGPADCGWNGLLRDRNGRHLFDSGWHGSPEGGWDSPDPRELVDPERPVTYPEPPVGPAGIRW